MSRGGGRVVRIYVLPSRGDLGMVMPASWVQVVRLRTTGFWALRYTLAPQTRRWHCGC